MKRIPHMNALMTAFPWHLDADTPVVDGRRFMQDHDIRHLPVTRQGHELAGVVHYDDLAPGTEGVLADLMLPMCRVDVHERADQVLDMMAREHQSVVVVTHHDRLAGIFTWTDACRGYADMLREPFTPNNGNDVA